MGKDADSGARWDPVDPLIPDVGGLNFLAVAFEVRSPFSSMIFTALVTSVAVTLDVIAVAFTLLSL